MDRKLVEYIARPAGYGRGRIYAGRYADINSTRRLARAPLFRIKMAAEINLPCDMSVPVRDFSVPTDEQLRPAIVAALKELRRGRNVAVGCHGGIGRTGLFLGVITAILRPGVDPVKVVRTSYNPHAIETAAQEYFVRGFVKRNRLFVAWLRFVEWLHQIR